MAYIHGLNPSQAQELADKIFDNIDEYGVEELRRLRDLLSGETSVESYLAGQDEEEDDE